MGHEHIQLDKRDLVFSDSTITSWFYILDCWFDDWVVDFHSISYWAQSKLTINLYNYCKTIDCIWDSGYKLFPLTYICVWLKRRAGGAGGGTIAKDAFGNDVIADEWLKTHGPGDRTLTQGLKVLLVHHLHPCWEQY